jgi:hypothetical protein
LAAFSLLFNQGVHADNPFDGKTWERDSEEDNQSEQDQNRANLDDTLQDSVNNEAHEE